MGKLIRCVDIGLSRCESIGFLLWRSSVFLFFAVIRDEDCGVGLRDWCRVLGEGFVVVYVLCDCGH